MRPRRRSSAARPSLAADTLRRSVPTVLSRSLATHLAWSAVVLAAAATLVAVEMAASCPPGGPIAFGDCTDVRPFTTAVVVLAALLYVGALTAVRWWTAGLRRRGVADEGAVRDWYLLAASVGLVVAPLLAFTTISALR